MVSEISAFEEFKEHINGEKETIQKIAKKYKRGFLSEVVKRVRENGRKGLRSIYSEIYPEFKDVFGSTDVEHFYYRIDSGKAAEYISRYHEEEGKLIVVLPPSLEKTKESKTFIEYFGVGFKEDKKEGDFLGLVAKNFIIPMVTSLNPDDYNTPLWRNFFSEWKKRGLAEEHGYPLYVRRFEEIAKICDGKDWGALKEHFADEIRRKLGTKAEEKITPDPKLLKTEAYIYFSEKLAWLKLLGYDMVAETIMDLLKEGQLELATKFAFSFHQLIPAHFVYSKGGPVIYSEFDLNRAENVFNSITKNLKKKKEVKVAEILSWVSISPPFVSLRRVVRTMWSIVRPRLPLSESPAERAKDNYIILEKCYEPREEFNKLFNKTLHDVESKSDLNKMAEELHSKVKELEEAANNLTDTYFTIFKSKPEKLKAYAPIIIGIGAIGWVSTQVPGISTIVSEILGEAADRVIGEHLGEEFLQQFGFPFHTIPIDVWNIKKQIGVRESLQILRCK